MCCFSGRVRSVHDTRIFARSAAAGRQFVVYQMDYETDTAVAMVLPLPVALPSAENSVRFLNLDRYEAFFDDMDSGFPQAGALTFGPAAGVVSRAAPLKVESVGSYEASFVPTVADFSRLDARFRLPDDTWKKLPDYRDFGFAVFKLKPEATKVHPMAFEFASRLPAGQLFFPTVHIHDGQVHSDADYDHAIYLQGGAPKQQTKLKKLLSGAPDLSWQESNGIPVQFMKAGNTEGTVDPRLHVYKLSLRGEYLNRDLHVSLGAA